MKRGDEEGRHAIWGVVLMLLLDLSHSAGAMRSTQSRSTRTHTHTPTHTQRSADLQMGSGVCKGGFYGVWSSTTARYVCQRLCLTTWLASCWSFCSILDISDSFNRIIPSCQQCFPISVALINKADKTKNASYFIFLCHLLSNFGCGDN